MRILLIEDEVYLADALAQILKKENYSVDICNDGQDGYDYASSGLYDALIVDIMLPSKDGLSIVRDLRNAQIYTPILLLSARGAIQDKVVGLDFGADDYLPKPFDTSELLARIRSLTRRQQRVYQDDLTCGDLTLDKQLLELSTSDKKIALTLKEAEFIELFFLQNDITLSKDYILDKVWGYDSDANHNSVEVYISFLRKKLQYLQSNMEISTLRGVGYILKRKNGV